MKALFAFFLCVYFLLSASEEHFPVYYKERLRAEDAYASLFTDEVFKIKSPLGKSPIGFLFDLEKNAHSFYAKSLLLTEQGELVSYDSLKTSSDPLHPPAFFLFQRLEESAKSERLYKKRAQALIESRLSTEQIALQLESEFPFWQRLKNASPLFKALPGKFSGEWFPLKALLLKVYDKEMRKLVPIGNFTLYKEASFLEIRKTYKQWKKGQKSDVAIATLLAENYKQLDGIYTSNLVPLPSPFQLTLESFYVKYPWIIWTAVLYLAAICFSALSKRASFCLFALAFCFHTLLLFARSYLLRRPPVSNMFETLLYVPWLASFIILLYREWRKKTYLITIAAFLSFCLLTLSQSPALNQNLEPTAPVLNSQFWLIVHVMLVVGSYGFFLLSSLAAHVYLAASNKTTLFSFVLHSLYIGTLLLIAGTILGGVWAAQSWGRFWDWDPKESWAFISSCFYLILVHAYKFGKIGTKGLSIGAIIGALLISFTWYGVNYLIGSGLHTYGFGTGGLSYYLLFLTLEGFFIFYAYLKK